MYRSQCNLDFDWIVNMLERVQVGEFKSSPPKRKKNICSAVILLTGKRSLERRLGDLRLLRVRQATNLRTPVDFLAIQT